MGGWIGAGRLLLWDLSVHQAITRPGPFSFCQLVCNTFFFINLYICAAILYCCTVRWQNKSRWWSSVSVSREADTSLMVAHATGDLSAGDRHPHVMQILTRPVFCDKYDVLVATVHGKNLVKQVHLSRTYLYSFHLSDSLPYLVAILSYPVFKFLALSSFSFIC